METITDQTQNKKMRDSKRQKNEQKTYSDDKNEKSKFSIAQRLPVEIFDIIFSHINSEYVLEEGEKRKLIHRCQYRNCKGQPSLIHDTRLLNLAQTCHSFRQRALPILWSSILIRGKNYISFNNFLWSTSNREEIYLQHVKHIAAWFDGSSNTRFRFSLRRDNSKPFGIEFFGKKTYRIWFIKQSIFWLQYRNLKSVEFIRYPSQVPDILYNSTELLIPFLLFISQQSSRYITPRSSQDEPFLRKDLRPLNLHLLPQSSENSKSPKNDEELLNLIDECFEKSFKERMSSDINKNFRCHWICEALKRDPNLRKEVMKLHLNDWKLKKGKDVVYDKKSKDGCVHM